MTERSRAMQNLLVTNDTEEVMRESFYAPATRGRAKSAPKAAKAEHYEVICISLYKEDLGRLDEMVSELKQNGHRKMSRSALIRYALDNVDLSKLPRSY